MDVRLCPRCGAPLEPSATGAFESCRFCGVRGVAKEQEEPPPSMPEIAPGTSIETLFDRYVEGAHAFTRGEPFDERFMRAVEHTMGVTSSKGGEVRREIMNYVGALAIEGKKLAPGMNKRLDEALRKLISSASS